MKLTYSLSSSRTEGRGFLAVMVERVTPSMCQPHAKDRAKHSAIISSTVKTAVQQMAKKFATRERGIKG